MAHDERRGPYNFEVVAWEAWPPSRGGNGQRKAGIPGRPQDAHGIKVLVTNPDDEYDTHQFWSFTLQKYQSWPEWWIYIGGQMSQHGMDLADEGIPPDPQGDRDRTGRFTSGSDANFMSPEGWEEEGE